MAQIQPALPGAPAQTPPSAPKAQDKSFFVFNAFKHEKNGKPHYNVSVNKGIELWVKKDGQFYLIDLGRDKDNLCGFLVAPKEGKRMPALTFKYFPKV